ncbi:hypothetical protein N7470_002803 [Penicillium chermesinum]|nr:hypothetical protein N7470_002803 [Penicillium chermesinum]
MIEMTHMAPLDLIGLTPLDHLPAKLALPYILYFDTPDTQAALLSLQNGVGKLVSQLPWLTGDVVLHTPEDLKTRLHIAAPQVPNAETRILQVKEYDRDQDIQSTPLQSYLPVPTFIPASDQRPVLRFQANVFPGKIVLAMCFWHNVFDGGGAGVILEALAECITSTETPITQSIASIHSGLRSAIGKPPLFDTNTSAEQWTQIESAMASVVQTKRYAFSAEKVAKLKEACSMILPDVTTESTWVSSNDIITAVLAISVDRVLHPERANKQEVADFLMAVDLRRKVQLPKTYVGNVIYPIHDDIYFRDGQAEQKEDADLFHLTQLAVRVRNTLASMDDNLLYSASATVAECDDWTKLEGKPADIIITSWRGLKTYALDFGPTIGHITDFEPGFALVPGGCIFLPERIAEQGKAAPPWEVCITLKTGDDKALVADPLFSQILA